METISGARSSAPPVYSCTKRTPPSLSSLRAAHAENSSRASARHRTGRTYQLRERQIAAGARQAPARRAVDVAAGAGDGHGRPVNARDVPHVLGGEAGDR